MATGKKIKVNFEGVETRTTIPEADYRAKPVEITEEKSEAKKPYLAWVFEIVEGPFKGKRPKTYNTSLQPQALWNLRQVLEALGQEVPDGVMELDLKAIVDDEPECGITIEHETYEGRKQSNIVDFFPSENLVAGDETTITREDVMSMDEDELEELVSDRKLEVDLSDFKKLSDKRKAVADALEGGAGGDELPSEDDIDEMDEDALEKVNEEHDLGVDLDSLKKLSAKRQAIKEAIEERSSSGDAKITEESIMEMGKADLKEFCEEHDLEVELEGTTSAQRRAVLKAAKEKGLIEG